MQETDGAFMKDILAADVEMLHETEVEALRREVERLRLRNAELEGRLARGFRPASVVWGAVETAGDIFMVTDDAGRVLHANTPGMQMLLGEEPEGGALEELVLSERLRAGHPCRKVLEFAVRTGEGLALTEEQGDRLLECRAMPAQLFGSPVFFLGVFDITERDHARHLLLQAQRVLEERIAARTAALHVQMHQRMRAEEALRQEQEFFRLVLDTDPSFISVYDAQGEPLLANRAFTSLFGFAENAPLDEVFCSGSPAWVLVGDTAERVCRTGETVRREQDIDDALGTYRWYDTVTTPLHMPGGTVCALNIATDVTDRKVSQLALEQAHSELEERVKERTVALAELNGRLVREAMERLEVQKRLEENEARFRGLFFANQAIKLLVDAETKAVVEANDAALRFYGYSREQMLKLSLHDISLTPPQDLAERTSRLMKEGTAFFESKHRRVDGTLLDVEVYAGTIQDKGRRTVFSIVHDISERKEAERQVVEQRNHLTALMNALGDSAMLLDMRGRIITLNTAAANALNGSGKKLTGRVLFKCMAEGESAAHRRMFREVLSRGKPVRDELALGESVWDVTYYPVFDVQGQVAGVALYSKDVTARRRSEERMRWLSGRVLSAQEEERKRIGRELHDSTAQTLSGIKFMVEAELRAMDRKGVQWDTSGMRKVVSLLQGAITELRRIIMDLRPTVLDDLGLLSAMRWLQDEFSVMHPDIGFRLWLDLDEACLDERQKSVLFRVAQEALANAARHSGADALSVSLTREETFCCLAVTDNGVGFEPGETPPAGIGLDSMRERLELVEGQLHIASEKGRGTQVRAVVPLRTWSGRRNDDFFPQGA